MRRVTSLAHAFGVINIVTEHDGFTVSISGF